MGSAARMLKIWYSNGTFQTPVSRKLFSSFPYPKQCFIQTFSGDDVLLRPGRSEHNDNLCRVSLQGADLGITLKFMARSMRSTLFDWGMCRDKHYFSHLDTSFRSRDLACVLIKTGTEYTRHDSLTSGFPRKEVKLGALFQDTDRTINRSILGLP